MFQLLNLANWCGSSPYASSVDQSVQPTALARRTLVALPPAVERVGQMFTAQQYRARAAEFRAFLTNIPRSPNETRECRDLEQTYTTLAETRTIPFAAVDLVPARVHDEKKNPGPCGRAGVDRRMGEGLGAEGTPSGSLAPSNAFRAILFRERSPEPYSSYFVITPTAQRAVDRNPQTSQM
jgi:hypothetical protein